MRISFITEDIRQRMKTVRKQTVVRNLITIINVHASITAYVKNGIDEWDQLYKDLGKLISKQPKAASLVLIDGDFDVKVRKRFAKDACLERY